MSNRIIQGLWIGRRLSVMEQLSIRSFLAHGHEYHLYTYGEVKNVPSGTVICDASEILPKDNIFLYPAYKTYAGFANMFRYRLLYLRGGWWVDTDAVCVKPFDFESDYVFSSEVSRTGFEQANCGMLKAPAGGEFFRRAAEICLSTDNTTLEWGQTGPELMQKLIPQFGFQDHVRTAATFCPVPYPEWRSILDPDRQWKFGPDTYTIHLWHEFWRRSNRRKDAIYSAACLYEQLKQRYGLAPRSYSLFYRALRGKLDWRHELKRSATVRQAVVAYREFSAARSVGNPRAGAERL